jgi:hypothetical protein
MLSGARCGSPNIDHPSGGGPCDLVNTPASDRYKIPFLVGVVGHRDLVAAEVPQIRAAVDDVLRRLCEAYPDVTPTLLTSMADGADLLVAEVAADLNIPIIAVLPLTHDQCRADLESDEARAVFDRIYARSERLEVILPQNGAADDIALSAAEKRDLQFQRAGALVATYSALLIAIWDGRDTGHAAGTARVVEYRRFGMQPHDDDTSLPVHVLLGAQDNDLMYEIRCSRRSRAAEAADPPRVLGFTGSAVTGGEEIPATLATVLERISEFNRDVEEFRDDIAQRSHRLALPSPYPVPERLTYLDELFRAADWLGSHYRRAFTAALQSRYLLWAVMAFLLLSFKKESVGTIGVLTIYGVLIVFVLGLGLALWAHRRSWHRKYLDYRALAEGLRVDFYWEIAGVHRRFDGEFAHESFLQKQDIELEWIRAAMRAVSLRLAVRGGGTLPAGFAQAFAGWVGDDDPVNGSGQLWYYRKRIEALERRLELVERAGSWLLFAGLLLAVGFAIEVSLRSFGVELFPERVRGGLLWALALLTVYAVIFETYVSEKADRSMIRQYRYMYSLFRVAARELRSARSEAHKLDIMRSLGHACLAEHAQWILGHRDRRIEGLKW